MQSHQIVEILRSQHTKLECALNQMVRAAEYLCMHKMGNDTPAGTREIALEDLLEQIAFAKRVLDPS